MLSNHVDTIPDLLEPIEGWRAWRLDDKGLFHSPTRKGEWIGGKLEWDGTCRCGSTVNSKIVGGGAWLFKTAAKVARAPSAFDAAKQTAPTLAAGSDLVGGALNGLSNKARNQCHCGINAFATEHQVHMSGYFGSCAAVGVVHMSGEVREFAKGWRAQYAQIARVWATDEKYADAVRVAAAKIGATYEGVAAPDPVERAAAKRADMIKAAKFMGTVVAVQAAVLTGIEVARHHADKNTDDKSAGNDS